MDRLPWPEVLDLLYSGRRFRQLERIESEDEFIHILSEETEIEGGLDIEALLYMERIGLVEKDQSKEGYLGPFRLTEKGFDVAHEMRLREEHQNREKRWNQKQLKMSQAISFLTFGLLTVGVLQSIVVTMSDNGFWHWQSHAVVLVGVFILASSAIWLRKQRLFSPQNIIPIQS